jgi:crossover junction endodeoxyribonuclease RuvC
MGLILGIDPGAGGGLALIEGGTLVGHTRMPTWKVGSKTVVDARRLDGWLGGDQPQVAVIEAVGAMPGQGVTSMFSFGRALGGVEAWAAMRCPRIEYVAPQAWKSGVGLSKDKRASMALARRKFGDSPLWDVLANDGIAEAALMALWWMEKHGHG